VPDRLGSFSAAGPVRRVRGGAVHRGVRVRVPPLGTQLLHPLAAALQTAVRGQTGRLRLPGRGAALLRGNRHHARHAQHPGRRGRPGGRNGRPAEAERPALQSHPTGQ
jgi:hypothetical protein